MELSGFVEFLKWGWTALIAHSWHLHRKTDELQKQHAEFVKRKEFDDTVNSLRIRIEETHHDMTTRFDETRREITDRFDRLFSHLLNHK